MQERLFSRELNRLRARSPGFASGFPQHYRFTAAAIRASAAAPAQAPNSQPRLVSQPSPFPGLREPALRSIRGVKPKAPGEEMLSHPVAGVVHSNHAASPYLKLKPFASAGEVPVTTFGNGCQLCSVNVVGEIHSGCPRVPLFESIGC